jgi:alpha-galactosidase
MPHFGNWNLTQDGNGMIALHHISGVAMLECLPALSIRGEEKPRRAVPIASEQGAAKLAYSFDNVGLLRLTFRAGVDDDWIAVRCTFENTSDIDIPLDGITPLSGVLRSEKEEPFLIYRNGIDMVDITRLHRLTESTTSHCCTGLTDPNGSQSLVVGFSYLADAAYQVRVDSSPQGPPRVSALCPREGIHLEPGQSLILSELILGANQGLSKLLDRYAKQVAHLMGSYNGEVQTGWCSWYSYYGTETREDLRNEMRARRLEGFNGQAKVFQIDDGWNLPAENHARVWGDWEAGAKFPDGMGCMAEEIRSLGYTPGLWLAPFSVSPASQLFRDHPDWLVQGNAGPLQYWGEYGLDLSQAAVLDFIRDTFVRVFDTWGYDYVKIDFLLHAVQPGIRRDGTRTTTALYRRAMQVIRDVAGERFILACGCPMGPTVGIANGVRVGYDVSNRWFVPMNLENWPVGNCSIRPGAQHTIWRQWMHRNWWQNDPDCLAVGETPTPAERKLFADVADGAFKDSPPYGLSDEEAGFWVRLVWMTGGMSLLCHMENQLSAERIDLLKKAYPLHNRTCRMIDQYEDLDVVLFKLIDSPAVVGAFNLGETAKAVRLPAARVDLSGSWKLRERITGETLEGSGMELELPVLPPRSGRVWELVS